MVQRRHAGTAPPVWVSQNFLTSARTIQRLIRNTTLSSRDHVIEIGPGKGHITGRLMQSCRQVTAVEVDQKLYDRLLDKFRGAENLDLHHRDFLKWDLPASGSYKIFSNIPFCITTNILQKLALCKNPPAEAWLIMEKGAAKRFMGTPRESLRSLMLKPVFDLKIVYHFRREDFHPKPGVDVVMLHLKRKAQPDVPPCQRDAYERFVATGLREGKCGLGRMLGPGRLAKALGMSGMGHGFTPGETLYIQWLCLFRCCREQASSHAAGRKFAGRRP